MRLHRRQRSAQRVSAPTIALTAAVALAGIAGCGGEGSGDESDGAVTRLPAYDINMVPRERLTDGGTLRISMGDWPTQWNYNHLLGATKGLASVTRSFLPHAHRSDEKGVPHPDRDYVTSAKVTRSKPKQVVTYTLNRKARWSDGRPITWKDYAAQAKALSGRAKGYQIVSSTGYEQIQRVARGANDYEFTVTFSRPFGDWPALFSPLYPAATNASPAAFNKGWLNRVPVAAGPFKVARLDQTAKTVTVTRNDHWWGTPAKLDRIIFRSMDPGAATSAFANGEIDVLDIGADASAYRRAKQVPGAAIRKAAGPDWRHFTLNGTSPILRDHLVRKAVAMGISREAIARSDLADLDWPVQPLGNHFLVNTQAGYEDVSGEIGRYDPAKAGRLLDQAGWRRRGNVRYKNGRPLRLRFTVPSGVPTGKQEAELVQAMLAKVGAQVAIETVPANDYFDKYVSAGNFDIAAFSWIGTPYPVSSASSIFAMPQGDDIQQNYARIGSDQIDRAMQEAVQELDPRKARQKTNVADRLIWEQVHTLALYQRPQLVAARRGLANYGAFGMYEPAYQDIGFTR